MHSLTYTQKSCRQNAGSRDAYVYMRTFFATRKPQQANQRAESKKNAYTIYTLNIHFLYSKSAYTIYTPETTFPAGSSTSNGPVTTLPPHILQAYTTQQSQATTMQPLQYIKKRYILTQPQAYTYFFAHFSRFLQNGKHGVYIQP